MKSLLLNNFRKILTLLSFFYKNDLKSLKVKSDILQTDINKRLEKFEIKNQPLKKTHQIFNQNLLKYFKNKNIISFLREAFIQQMFFVHNRLFIFYELKQLQKSKNWQFYKKLLAEDDIGNPIRYFLYPTSSGNRINHVFHLSILFENLNINFENISYVFEFGGGYGCMARIFSLIDEKIFINIYDTELVNHLQYYYLNMNNLDVSIGKSASKIQLLNENNFDLINDNIFLNNKNYLFIANWSFSEISIVERNKLIKIIENSKNFLICFQEYFEEINNYFYFKKLQKKLSKKYEIKIIGNKYYRGNFIKKQRHFFFIGKIYHK